VVGFKAEMDEQKAKSNAVNMLENKNLDAVCLNLLKDSSSFGTDVNEIEFITNDKNILLLQSDKLTLSFRIISHSKKLSE